MMIMNTLQYFMVVAADMTNVTWHSKTAFVQFVVFRFGSAVIICDRVEVANPWNAHIKGKVKSIDEWHHARLWDRNKIEIDAPMHVWIRIASKQNSFGLINSKLLK